MIQIAHSNLKVDLMQVECSALHSLRIHLCRIHFRGRLALLPRARCGRSVLVPRARCGRSSSFIAFEFIASEFIASAFVAFQFIAFQFIAFDIGAFVIFPVGSSAFGSTRDPRKFSFWILENPLQADSNFFLGGFCLLLAWGLRMEDLFAELKVYNGGDRLACTKTTRWVGIYRTSSWCDVSFWMPFCSLSPGWIGC